MKKRWIMAMGLCLAVNMGMTAIAWAQTARTDACTDKYENFGAWRFHRLPTGPDCFTTVEPVTSGLLYRSYLFSESGTLMVFNSYDDSIPGPAATGARMYYFFPRNQAMDFSGNAEEVVVNSATRGISLIFGVKPGALSFTGITAKIDPVVNATNDGGVEILSSPTLWLDSGFGLGFDPTTNPDGISVFHDVNAHTCSVKNSEIFSYTPDGNDEFKFSDSELKTFLQTRCPGLFVNY